VPISSPKKLLARDAADCGEPDWQHLFDQVVAQVAVIGEQGVGQGHPQPVPRPGFRRHQGKGAEFTCKPAETEGLRSRRSARWTGSRPTGQIGSGKGGLAKLVVADSGPPLRSDRFPLQPSPRVGAPSTVQPPVTPFEAGSRGLRWCRDPLILRSTRARPPAPDRVS